MSESAPNSQDDVLGRLLNACNGVPYLATCVYETITKAGLCVADAKEHEALKARLHELETALSRSREVVNAIVLSTHSVSFAADLKAIDAALSKGAA